MNEVLPFREPLRVTLTRTVGIALIAGAIVASWSGGVARWPALTLLMLWPSLGGHWIDLVYLNGLAPRLPAARGVRAAARLAVWALGGILLAVGVRLTARAVFSRDGLGWLTLGRAALGFVAIELIAHGGLQLRGRPSFYNGRG